MEAGLKAPVFEFYFPYKFKSHFFAPRFSVGTLKVSGFWVIAPHSRTVNRNGSHPEFAALQSRSRYPDLRRRETLNGLSQEGAL